MIELQVSSKKNGVVLLPIKSVLTYYAESLLQLCRQYLPDRSSHDPSSLKTNWCKRVVFVVSLTRLVNVALIVGSSIFFCRTFSSFTKGPKVVP